MPNTDLANSVRKVVLDLHKALMDAQRIRYEKHHGRISNTSELLGLVLEHPQFAWLRAMSALIARLDEWQEGGKDASDEDLAAIVSALRELIEVNGKHAAFSAPYWEIVNDTPEALVSHVKLWRLIGPERAAPGGAQSAA
ncbi:MAG TPA: hypothetical protein VH301_17955 [Usitatibacter sp.]|jgi:hypothetical protein|nr:hypothetical protein [Usitatibacter sp.]